MKTSLRLFILLIFLFACYSFNKAKTAGVKESSTVSVDSSAIPTDYSFVDTIPKRDSLALLEPEEPKNPLEYMTIEEKGMIDEINLLRADPQAYARFIDDYTQSFVSNPYKNVETKRKEMAVAGKLIIDLQTMEPLPALLPHYKLYKVAKLDGANIVETKKMNTIGSDGSHPFQRIYEGAELDGDENIIYGLSSTRKTIISILIENSRGDQSRQLNLLDAQWEYVTCYRIGTVGEVDNVWLQLFGFSAEEEEKDSNNDVFKNAVQDIEEITTTASIVPPAEKSISDINYSFMSREEKKMIDEINILRTNPAKYFQYVESYALKHQKQFTEEEEEFSKAVKELKQELMNIEPLSVLQPNEKLYNVARAHGLDNKTNHQLEHIGSDQSDPFDRVKRSGLKNYIDKDGNYAPNENLVGGESSPRESVVALLIDAGVYSRGHRKALLEPHWKYVACYKIGQIENLRELKGQQWDDMNNCWVQLFAMD